MSKTISLTEAERELLSDLLENELQQVRSENYHAESHSVKEMLKERKESISRILKQLTDMSSPQ